METQSAGEHSVRSVSGGGNSSVSKAFCRCGEGWECIITRRKGPDAGKAFFDCGENCTFVTYADGTVTTKDLLCSPRQSEAYCECGEGWKCVISKVQESDIAGKGFFECADGCTCVTDA